MITPKTILLASVALAAVLSTPAAQARDHGHHRGDRYDDRYHGHRYYGHSYYGYNQGYYYDQGPSVVYADPYYNDRYYGDRYYGRSNFGLTFAFGGHRGHHYHH